jgi:hypothetical protein
LLRYTCTYIATGHPVVRGPAHSQVARQGQRLTVKRVRLPALNRAAHGIHSGVHRGIGAADLEGYHNTACNVQSYNVKSTLPVMFNHKRKINTACNVQSYNVKSTLPVMFNHTT